MRITAGILLLISVVLMGCASEPSVQHVETTIPGKDQINAGLHGNEIGLRMGALSGTGGTMANGVATMHVMEDGTLIIGLQLNIAPAKPGFRYSAWIQEGLTTPKVALGTLSATTPEVRHSLRIETKAAIQSYTLVSITLEGGGKTPGSRLVATGRVKEIAR